MQGHPSRLYATIALVALSAFSLFFVATALTILFTDGLCCVDDSVFGVAARNLAFGAGYSNSITLSGVPGIVPFSSDISTGPVMIVPAAGMVRLFGNEPWVPGLTSALFWISGFCAIFAGHLRSARLAAASTYMLFLLVLSYLFTTSHFEHWYALLGEMPAALTCIIAATVIARPTRTSIFLGSLLLGCAIMIKLLTALSFVLVAGWLLWRARGGKREAADLVLAVSLFLLPAALFQLWQLLSMGGEQYVASLRAFWEFAMQTGAPGAGKIDYHIALIAKNSEIFRNHFGFSVWLLLFAGVVLSAILCIPGQDERIRRMGLLLMAMALPHFAWWLAVSNGWPRYILIGLVIYSAGLATLVYFRPVLIGAVAASAIVLFLALVNPLLAHPYQRAKASTGGESARLRNLREVAQVLRPLPRPLVTDWMGTAADMEYMLPTAGSFIRAGRLPPEANQRRLVLAFNKRWLVRTPEFVALEKRCTDVIFDKDPYVVALCAPASATPGQ
jgi:hypothetical protein